MDESIIKFFKQKQIIKPSEAIRKGAGLRPKCTGVLFEDGNSCVIGAWLEGSGIEYKELADFEYIPKRLMLEQFHNMDRDYRKKYGSWVWHDNDKGVSRESIADRLEALGY